MGIRIGYYPIKENEIKQVVKMVYSYYKKDNSYVEEVMKKHNVNENKKKDIFNSFDQCIQNKSNEYFDLCFGVCAAKVQKMYRGNFVLENKSITELMRKFPILGKYKTNLEDFIIFKNNKYKFVNALNFPNSSGVYLSYDNIEKLYNDYYFDITIKKAIDNYYGSNGTEYSNKFIEILDYCMKNKCGLLEANFLGESIQKNVTDVNNMTDVKNAANIENEKTKSQANTSNRKKRTIISAGKMMWPIIGYRILWEFVALIIIEIIQMVTTPLNNLLTLKLIFNTLISLITAIAVWRLVIKSAFTHKTIKKEDIFKLVRNIAIFMFVVVSLNAVLNYYNYNNKIENLEKENTELRIRSSIVNSYGTKELREEYQKQIEDAKTELKKKIQPYYIGSTISSFCINLGVLPYVKKLIKSSVDD